MDLLKATTLFNTANTNQLFYKKISAINFVQVLRKKVKTQHIARNTSLAFMLLILTGCITDLQVSRHANVNLTNANADNILTDFSEAVRVVDAPGDFACADGFGTINGVTYEPAFYLREGNVGVFNGTNVINNANDFAAVLAKPGQAKVVNAINWCGAINPNIIGCAPIGGASFVVERFTANMEGILWAHEYGHNVGLEHRNVNRALMRDFIGANHNIITAAECNSLVSRYTRYIDLSPAQSMASQPLGAAGKPHQTPLKISKSLDGELKPTNNKSTDIVSFVRRIYVHGTPMESAISFENTGAEPILLSMLGDPQDKPYWGNIVSVLGMIGGQTVTQPLINFAEQEKNKDLGGENMRQITAAMMGLGYLANRTGDAQALGYLKSASSPLFWSNKKQNFQQQLAISASLGLALSGRPEARQTLSLPPAQPKNSTASSTAMGKLSNTLLDLHTEIAQKGLKGYYAR